MTIRYSRIKVKNDGLNLIQNGLLREDTMKYVEKTNLIVTSFWF